MTVYLANAFSINMLPRTCVWVRFERITVEEARQVLRNGFVSAVGHADTARLFTNLLGIEVVPNRATVALWPSDALIVGQYSGPRLPEGSTTLPEGATIEWWHVITSE